MSVLDVEKSYHKRLISDEHTIRNTSWKGRGTRDNIYVLNHIIQKEIRKKGGRVFRFFMEISKSAFDRVDRKILWETMERR